MKIKGFDLLQQYYDNAWLQLKQILVQIAERVSDMER